VDGCWPTAVVLCFSGRLLSRARRGGAVAGEQQEARRGSKACLIGAQMEGGGEAATWPAISMDRHQWWRQLLIGGDEEGKRMESAGEWWCWLHCALMVRLKEGKKSERRGRSRSDRCARARSQAGVVVVACGTDGMEDRRRA
jgi:hypothetical protein